MTSLADVETLWEKVCFDPDYQPEGRYQTYRDLVYEGMLDVLQSVCPVACEILRPAEWQQIFWEFLRKAPPKSVVIRQLPYEASQYLKSHEHCLSNRYPWLGELMEYEYLEVGVRFAEEFNLARASGQVSINPAHALAHYTWPVHYISGENFDPETLPRGEYYLFLWRDPESLEVHFMEVNSVVAVLFEQLKIQPQSVEKLLHQVAKQMEIEVSEAYLAEGNQLIEDLLDKGILL